MRLPRLNEEKGGYFVFFTLLLDDDESVSRYCYGSFFSGATNSWQRIHSSSGWTWTIKGFAINAAKKYKKWFAPDQDDGELCSCVVDTITKKVVWKSWKDEEHPDFNSY